ncbi:MAG: murein biosynthesis integral membrane protein MurJ [Rickettsiales bacterium]|jgi:putative peptidoglycan lipid II flippase|nr:murein biosynthesis integral membrane protein MurJ [Rickettsiales bacterium]|tara:strand:+ start:6421 stop:7947 length:1527 start_codon:yes stop_codon:yes gene_type:complete
MYQRFFKSIFTISFFTAISRIFGFIRDILIAKFIGVSIYSDVFFAAFRLPNFFRRIFAEGAFNSAFIPIFVDKKNQNIKQGKIFASNIFSLLFYILLILVIMMQIFMPFLMQILFPGFFDSSIKAELLISMSRITIFYLIFISLVSLMSAILNSANKFSVPAAAPIILNVTLIFAVIYLVKYMPTYVHALSWGVFIAGLLQLIFLFIFTKRAGYLLYPKIPNFNNDIKRFFKKLAPAIIGGNVMQINLLIDSIFASLTLNAISYLYYADRVNQLPLALIGIAIGVALLPRLSSLISNNKHQEALKLQNIAIKFGILLSFPAAIGLILLSSDIIKILFERGDFSALDTKNVAQALSLFALALPAYIMVKILEPSFFARHNTKTPMKIALICMILNIILNILFYNLGYGYRGIILASIFASYLHLILLLYCLNKRSYFKLINFSLFEFLRLCLPSTIMALFIIFVANKIDLSTIITLLFQIITAIIIYILSLIASNYSFVRFQLLKIISK